MRFYNFVNFPYVEVRLFMPVMFKNQNIMKPSEQQSAAIFLDKLALCARVRFVWALVKFSLHYICFYTI